MSVRHESAWEVLESRYLLRRRWMDVREDRVRLPNGVIIDEFHVLEYPDWVAVIPVTVDDRLVLVEQYRHGVQRVCIEFPAGVIEPDEDLVVAAERELLEETGYSDGAFEYVGRCAPEPSRHSNLAHVVIARGVRRGREPAPDDDEVIRVRTVPVSEIGKLIEDDHFIHGVHYAALLMAMAKGYLTL